MPPAIVSRPQIAISVIAPNIDLNFMYSFSVIITTYMDILSLCVNIFKMIKKTKLGRRQTPFF